MTFDYLFSARQIKGGEFLAEPGPVRFLKVPAKSKTCNPSHVIPVNDWASEIQGLADGDENPYSVSPTGDILIFIHGYNNHQEIVLTRLRQLKSDLRAEGWRGTVVAFDWPSDNQTLNYLEDRSDAAEVAHRLVEDGIKRLSRRQQAGCCTNIHLLGHSTGAYVIMEAFEQAQKNGVLFKSDWRVGQTAFIGGDVSSESLSVTSDWAKPFYARIMRLTNYSNPFDSVLGVSNAKRLGVAPRAGRTGLPAAAHPKSVDVDCGPYFQSLDPKKSVQIGSWTHSWHIGNRVFARDLAMTMEGAIDRHAITTRERGPDGRMFLADNPRPRHQLSWGIKESAQRRNARA